MNRRTFVLISVSVSAAIVVSLSISLPLYYHYSSLFYPEITIVSYQLNPEAGEEWTLNVSAIRSSSCVIIKDPIVEFPTKQEYTIRITIKAKHPRGVQCLAMIVEWNHQFELTFPQSGNWTVHCNDKTITVYVQEPCFC